MSRRDGDIYCNRCGKVICSEGQKEKTSFLTLRKEWGYFSDNKDGKRYSVDLCEPCCDEMVQGFAVAPEIEEYTEYV